MIQVATPPGITSLESLQVDVLVGLCRGCPSDGIHAEMFSGWPYRTVHRLIGEYYCECHELPSGPLLSVLVETSPQIPDIYREECSRIARDIAHHLEFPGEPLGVRHFDSNKRLLQKQHRQQRGLRLLEDLSRRIENGEDPIEFDSLSLVDPRETQAFGAKPFADMLASFKSLREPIVQGLGRRGETANIVSGTKIGKTWLMHFLALCLASGRNWLGYRIDRPRKVLLLDNELHEETLIWRIRSVAEAMGLQEEDYAPRLRVEALRGKGVNVTHLPQIARQNKKYAPDFVGIDSWYRFTPQGANENDNSAMKDVAEQMIGFADDMNALVAIVHHSTKGDQSERSVTDVGSGAGSISRAADTHLILRAHREDGCAVMEARVRSFEQPKPIVLRWGFPLWTVDGDLNPNELRSPRQQKRDADEIEFLEELVDAVTRLTQESKDATQSALMSETSWRRDKVVRLISAAERAGRIVREESGRYPKYLPALEVNGAF